MRTALIVVLLAMPSAAQSQSARISGDVRDQQGAVLSGVTVDLAATGTARTTRTDDIGRFVFTDLPGGTYELTTTLSGFRTGRTRVPVAPGSDAMTAVRLRVGTLTDTITVADQAAARPPIEGVAQNRRVADAYLDAAKLYNAEGRFADAEAMTLRALGLIRAGVPQGSVLAAPRADASGPVRVGGALSAPRKVRHIEPAYPDAARAAGVEGLVLLEATITPNGSVTNARVLNGVPQLGDAALQAVRQWHYSPSTLNGTPIEVALLVTVTFVLK